MLSRCRSMVKTKLAGEEACRHGRRLDYPAHFLVILRIWHELCEDHDPADAGTGTADHRGRSTGTPTYAADLAEMVIHILQFAEEQEWKTGIYHFSNKGETTWFGFAGRLKSLLASPPVSSFPSPRMNTLLLHVGRHTAYWTCPKPHLPFTWRYRPGRKPWRVASTKFLQTKLKADY